MAKRGGGMGLVLLVVVLAVVLTLVARGWKDAGGMAIDVTRPEASVNHRGQSEAAGAVQELPGLKDVQREADAHAQQVQDALKSIE